LHGREGGVLRVPAGRRISIKPKATPVKTVRAVATLAMVDKSMLDANKFGRWVKEFSRESRRSSSLDVGR
jgi:hypothetical protein